MKLIMANKVFDIERVTEGLYRGLNDGDFDVSSLQIQFTNDNTYSEVVRAVKSPDFGGNLQIVRDDGKTTSFSGYTKFVNLARDITKSSENFRLELANPNGIADYNMEQEAVNNILSANQKQEEPAAEEDTSENEESAPVQETVEQEQETTTENN